jgi:dihydropteroate synthase
MLFRARQFEFRFPRPALVMGIVNVTPDSFSDGGKFFDGEAAVAHALGLVAQGAEILDIGGESTRPGAEPVSEEAELRRVIPVIQQLAAKTKIALSIDTLKPAVARAALAAGASIVNDVGAIRSEDSMWKIVAEFHAGYVCMHTTGSDSGPAVSPVALHLETGPAGGRSQDESIVRQVSGFFSERLMTLLNETGIAADQVVLDPGIGFGKTLAQNLQLLANLRSFAKWRRPLLLGVSRKSFIEKSTGAKLNERLPASLACATLAVAAGVQIIRTHDVAATVQAVRMTEAILPNGNVD